MANASFSFGNLKCSLKDGLGNSHRTVDMHKYFAKFFCLGFEHSKDDPINEKNIKIYSYHTYELSSPLCSVEDE